MDSIEASEIRGHQALVTKAPEVMRLTREVVAETMVMLTRETEDGVVEAEVLESAEASFDLNRTLNFGNWFKKQPFN